LLAAILANIITTETFKQNMKKIILLTSLLITLLFGQIFSQTTNSLKKYSQSELNQDLDSLRSYIVQTHPNPFSVISKNDFDKRITEIKKQFSKPLTLRVYYNLIAPLIASISDGHTTIKYAGNKFLTDGSNLFPYIAKLSYDSPNIVVNGYIYDTLAVIPNGAEIISINDISSKKIIEKFIENTSGESNQYRLKTASNIFLGSLLFTYFDFNDKFKVKFKFNNIISTKVIPSITFADLRKQMQSKKQPAINTEKTLQDYSLILKKELKTAIIDFRYFNDEAKFQLFIDSSFSIIKKEKIESLIIDIRENGGGNSIVGDQLFKYISKQKFTQFGKTIIKYSQLQKDFYKVKCEEDSTMCDTYNYLIKQTNGKTEVLENENLISPNTNQFGGKIYLLTSLKTFSSASTFAQCFKNYKMGTIIGEETGGWIVAYGDKITATLPVTNLSITISQKKFYTVGATVKDFHGIIPDIKIKSENALDFTLKKIESAK
jgi:hypothetical protein